MSVHDSAIDLPIGKKNFALSFIYFKNFRERKRIRVSGHVVGVKGTSYYVLIGKADLKNNIIA